MGNLRSKYTDEEWEEICKEAKRLQDKSLATSLMTDPSIYKPLGEAFKGWGCTVDKEGIKIYYPKK